MKKRILFLIHTLGGGGAEKVLVNLVNNLSREKYDITLMTVVDTGIYRNSLKEHISYKTIIKIPFLNVPPKGNVQSGSLLGKKTVFTSLFVKIYQCFWRYANTAQIHRKYIGNQYDIEIAFLEGICAKIIAASSNKESQKYAWIHVDLLNQHKSAAVFKNSSEEQRIYNQFDCIICVSNFVKEQFQKMFSVDKERIIVRYNPVDEAEILAKSKAPPKKPITEKKRFTLCTVGRLNEQKSYGRLLECVKHLTDQGYHFDLWIIGEGTGYKKLSHYIQKNNLQSTVTLLGFQKNPYYYMAQSDMFVCSSIAEGFSTVATEAIILGLPIVTTDCAGMQELLGNSVYGIITENSVSGLENGIKHLLENKVEYENYKTKALFRGKMFKIKETIDEIQDIL